MVCVRLSDMDRDRRMSHVHRVCSLAYCVMRLYRRTWVAIKHDRTLLRHPVCLHTFIAFLPAAVADAIGLHNERTYLDLHLHAGAATTHGVSGIICSQVMSSVISYFLNLL